MNRFLQRFHSYGVEPNEIGAALPVDVDEDELPPSFMRWLLLTNGRIPTLPRSAAVSKTSRSSFATSGRWNTPDASGYFDVLRLVEDDTAALRFGCVRGQCADAPLDSFSRL